MKKIRISFILLSTLLFVVPYPSNATKPSVETQDRRKKKKKKRKRWKLFKKNNCNCPKH